MCRTCLDLFESGLQVIHCPSASWTGDIFRFVESSACSLHEFVFQIAAQTGFDYLHSLAVAVFICSGNMHFVKFLVQKTLSEVAGKMSSRRSRDGASYTASAVLPSSFSEVMLDCSLPSYLSAMYWATGISSDRILSQGNWDRLPDSF